MFEFMYSLSEKYPKSYRALAKWSICSKDVPISELKYDYSQWSSGWAFYYKNGNGKCYNILELFRFFRSNKVDITLKEYENEQFESLFKKLELVLESEDTSEKDVKYIELNKYKGNVFIGDDGTKICISEYSNIESVVKNNFYKKIFDKPHEDNDFSYICGFEHCKCHQ